MSQHSLPIWLASAEIRKAIMEHAKLISESSMTNPSFMKDIPTCYMLCLYAYKVNLDPQFVASNMFRNEYDRVVQNGRLTMALLRNNTDITSFEFKTTGDWSLIRGRAVLSQENPSQPRKWMSNWSHELEKNLGLEMIATKANGNEVKLSVYLCHVSADLRMKNDNWAANPERQLYYYLVQTFADMYYPDLISSVDGGGDEPLKVESSFTYTPPNSEPKKDIAESSDKSETKTQDDTHSLAAEVTPSNEIATIIEFNNYHRLNLQTASPKKVSELAFKAAKTELEDITRNRDCQATVVQNITLWLRQIRKLPLLDDEKSALQNLYQDVLNENA